jgi:putative MATE family efflux protein
MFTRQALIALLLPLIAEQALSVTIGLADTLMVSSIGEAAVSGVSLVDSFNTLMIQVLSALATGGAVVTSQYIGRREGKTAKSAAAQILFIMLAFSCAVALVVAAGRHFILRAIFGSIDDDVMNYAKTYFLLSALSYPFMGMYSAGAALFRAQGNSKVSMFSSLVMNIVNIGGNAYLIFVLHRGVMGAALASLVSRAIACFAVLFLLQREDCPLRLDSLSALKPDRDLIGRILAVGIPNSIENSMFQIGKLAVSSLVSTMGTTAIAANAVAATLNTFLNIPANAVGMAVLTVVGQCLGAGEKEQAKHYSSRLLFVAYAGAWIMNLSALLFLNRFTVTLFNLSPEAQAMTVEVMIWFNIFSLFIWPSSFTLPNILRAAGDSQYTMRASIFSMWLFRVGFCYVAVKCFHGGLLSVWMGMYLDWAFRSLLFGKRYLSGKWLEQKVI